MLVCPSAESLGETFPTFPARCYFWDALLPGPIPRHPGDRASEAHPVQEVGGWRGGSERAVQLRLPLFLLATRVAEGRGVLGVMAVSTLPSKMRPE